MDQPLHSVTDLELTNTLEADCQCYDFTVPSNMAVI
uniref:Uncharacterized protein n=1 Tax=Anguilla anguilla TaxID=7936 RepID=A0A0E9TA97_ANGAN